ncbi:MAG: ABC-2 family transporter protein [Eubacteriales bacterium]|nr:ABC-2 family transporter protein [Eubacteriales bacterium]
MRLYFRYLAVGLKSQMQDKTSFFLTLIGQGLSSFTTYLGVAFMMRRFHQVDGFTYAEVLLCFATVLMAFSLAETFARGFDRFSVMIGNGEFDRALVRPRSAIFQVLAAKPNFSRLGRLLQAMLVLGYAMPNSGVHWTWDRICTLLGMIFGGMVLFSSLFLLYAGLCFFTTEGLEVMNVFTDGGREFGRYPLSIYGKRVLQVFTYMVPLALVQYYPLLYLLGRTDDSRWMLAPLAACLFVVPAYGVWRIGLRHYRSTGS